jgi:protein-S-isoprenylcysteine O-methyltransferase Ste14
MKAESLTGLFWMAWILYWIVSARGVKKNAPGGPGRRARWIRVLFIVGAIVAFQFPAVRMLVARHWHFTRSPAAHVSGVALCAAGLLFAVWARRRLGRNWGAPMSVKENPELITTGPYALVRHPIYSGILLAMLGSILAGGMFALVWLVFSFPYFMYSIWMEDRLMTRQFPGEYPAYKRRSKLLVPFIL